MTLRILTTGWTRWAFFGLGLWLCALVAQAGVAWADNKKNAAPNPPKTIAFVVGVLNYEGDQASEFNNLLYTAEDAEDVFVQLDRITELKTNRSRLLLAVRKEEVAEGTNDLEHVTRREFLSSRFVRDEFRNFLGRIRNGDNVVIYFGGHGIARGKGEVQFLGSDYPTHKSRYLSVKNLLNELELALTDPDKGSFADVKVTLLLNMCGAGNVKLSGESKTAAQIVHTLSQRHTFGLSRVAVIPSSAEGRNTFEDREQHKRSIMAHHILEGLKGSAANHKGQITSGGLFEVVKAGIEKDANQKIEPIGKFDRRIVIGSTRGQEAFATYLQALSLLAVARDDPQDETFLSLSRNRFKRVTGLGDRKLAALAQLRIAQSYGLAGNLEKEYQNSIEQLARPETLAFLSGSARSDADRLLALMRGAPGSKAPVFPTLSSFGEYLKAGNPFATLIMCGVRSQDCTGRTETEMWKGLFGNFVGNLSTVVKSEQQFLNKKSKFVKYITSYIEKLTILAKKNRYETRNFPLVFVFEGQNEFYTEYLTKNMIKNLLYEIWPGPIVIIFNMRDGAKFINENIPNDNETRLHLFVSAPEENTSPIAYINPITPITLILAPFTENHSQISEKAITQTSYLLAEAILTTPENIKKWPTFQTYKDIHKELDFRISAPVWIRFGDSTSTANLIEVSKRTISDQLASIKNMAVLLAGNCAHRPISVCKLVSDFGQNAELALNQLRNEAPSVARAISPFDELTLAVRADMTGKNPSSAISGYRNFLRNLDKLLKNHAQTRDPFGDEMQEMARNWLGKFRGVAQKRLRELRPDQATDIDRELGSEIRIIGIAVDAYDSPLVPSLKHTKSDIDAATQMIKSHFHKEPGGLGRAVTGPEILHNPRTANDVRAFLTKELKRVKSGTSVLFIYSGRGYSAGGQRYLSTSGVDLEQAEFDSESGKLLRASTVWDLKYLIELSEIAELARGRSLVGIYDTQFDTPQIGENRVDQILDKHLDSVRPIAPDPTAQKSEFRSRFVTQGGKTPDGQVHIFWDGRLTEPLHRTPTCLVDQNHPSSPVLAALVDTVRSHEILTYRDLISQTTDHPCLRTAASSGNLVVQGALHLPIFASGSAAEPLVYISNETELKRLNLNIARDIATIVRERFSSPMNRLVKQATKVKFLEIEELVPRNLRNKTISQRPYRDSWINRIKQGLVRLSETNSQSLDNFSQFSGVLLDLRTRILPMNNEFEAARLELYNAAKNGNLPPKLVLRLVDLTERSLNTKPTEVIGQMVPVMQSALKGIIGHPAYGPIEERWRKLNRRIEDQAGPYVINVGRFGTGEQLSEQN